MANRVRSRILLGAGAFLFFLALLIWMLSARSLQPARPATTTGESSSASPTVNSNQPTPIASNTAQAEATTPTAPEQASPAPSLAQPENSPPPLASSTQTPSSTSAPLISPAAPFGSATLLVPVAGVRPGDLRDTFQEARSEGRAHDAIDIPAARGTPVLAVADGRLVKFFNSEKGGITIYQLSVDEKMVYYYAHLERYADGIREGHFARRGELLAYVGDTGNAGPGNYHLHFSVAILSDPKRYWAGTNINPYPLMRGTQ
jgi:murein DD-endopeptidase MepM/ murein hydrolase activator NlpD